MSSFMTDTIPNPVINDDDHKNSVYFNIDILDFFFSLGYKVVITFFLIYTSISNAVLIGIMVRIPASTFLF